MTSTPGELNPVALQVSVERDGETTVLSATGDVDYVTAPQLEQAAHRALEDVPAVLVLDLGGVTFLPSLDSPCWCGPTTSPEIAERPTSVSSPVVLSRSARCS